VWRQVVKSDVPDVAPGPELEAAARARADLVVAPAQPGGDRRREHDALIGVGLLEERGRLLGSQDLDHALGDLLPYVRISTHAIRIAESDLAAFLRSRRSSET